MADSSFDIVSKVDHQEAENALNQARKEVEQRYDFKGADASIEWSGEAVLIRANSEERAKAVVDLVFDLRNGDPVSKAQLDSHSEAFGIAATLNNVARMPRTICSAFA